MNLQGMCDHLCEIRDRTFGLWELKCGRRGGELLVCSTALPWLLDAVS